VAGQPDENQKQYRAAALRILADIEGADVEDLSPRLKREALLYLAEALTDLAETMTEESSVSDPA